jgi:hypothetical protein
MRYQCVKECYWKKRLWDPKSPVEKDRVYAGEDVPPEDLFKALAEGEKSTSLAPEPDKPIAFSQIQKKTMIAVDPFGI